MYFKLLVTTISLCLLNLSILKGQEQQYLLLHSDAIYFKSGSHKVNTEYTNLLKKIAKVINENEEARIWIQAHTDSLGSYVSNQKLSDRRAASVYEALAKLGVDSAQLRIDSHGEYMPFISNGTVRGRALNRRVTIEVVKPRVVKPKEVYTCTVRGKVVDASNQKPVSTLLRVYTSMGADSVTTDEEGNYVYEIGVDRILEIRAYAEGYFFVAKDLKPTNDRDIEVNFSLEPAVTGGKMALNDLYFQGGTPLLMPSSKKALESVLEFMQFNADLKIEIGGHINKPNQAPVPESSSSFKLSESRAAVVYYYLIEHGIDENRLEFKGYGNSEMLYPRASTFVQEQLNRRVELKVVD